MSLPPILLDSKPEVVGNQKEDNSGVEYLLRLRKEAKWDDGSDITAEDVLFSIKLVLNPFSASGGNRRLLQSIDKFSLDPENPKQFKVRFEQRHIHSELVAGGIYVFPPQIYDPEGWLEGYSFDELKVYEADQDPETGLFVEIVWPTI